MCATQGLKAKIVKGASFDIPLQEGEEVTILGLDRGPDSRWFILVSGPAGVEVRLRPFLVGESRSPDAFRLPKLHRVSEMVDEFRFWEHLWKQTYPRKADAMERMAEHLAKTSKERQNEAPSAVLHAAWSQYGQERLRH